MEQRDGTGSLSATQAMSYDALGNLASVDGPLSGTADTTTYRYNAARQLVGVISADPDGAGSLVRRAVRTNFSSSTGLSRPCIRPLVPLHGPIICSLQ